MKKIGMFFLVFICLSIDSFLAQTRDQIMREAFSKFSRSPFKTLYVSGGAYYSGDDLYQMPMLVNYYSSESGNKQNIRAVDGLFGGLLFDAKANANALSLNVPQWETNFTTSLSTFTLGTPIMEFPKMYSDLIQYVFIDTSRRVIASNITIGSNWHSIRIDYRDRVDTIVFSAQTSRVRTFTSQFRDNVLTVELGSYTEINKIPYPMSFILTSSVDKREIRFNVTNVVVDNMATAEAKKIGW